jgi:ABC-type branched-subunit amino acid transport system permease subunit
MVIYGAMILLFVLFMPHGLVTIKDRVFGLRKAA